MSSGKKTANIIIRPKRKHKSQAAPNVGKVIKQAAGKVKEAFDVTGVKTNFYTFDQMGELSKLMVLSKENPDARFVIFDLDGCIADDEWRHPFVKSGAEGDEKFEDYHSASIRDEMLEEGKKLLLKIVSTGFNPIFITARPEKHRKRTVNWINGCSRMLGIPCDNDQGGFFLFMRPDGTRLSSVDVKKNIVTDISTVLNLNRIVAAYDDREDIITMYNAVFDLRAYILDRYGFRDHLGLIQTAAGPQLNLPQKATDEDLKKSKWDVVEAVVKNDDHCENCFDNKKEAPTKTDYRDVSQRLRAMASTFESRNAAYGDNGIKVGDVMFALFPHGLSANSAADHRIHHLFNLVIVKLTRFVNSGMKDFDSIHDLAVYAAMVESEVSAGEHEIVVHADGTDGNGLER